MLTPQWVGAQQLAAMASNTGANLGQWGFLWDTPGSHSPCEGSGWRAEGRAGGLRAALRRREAQPDPQIPLLLPGCPRGASPQPLPTAGVCPPCPTAGSASPGVVQDGGEVASLGHCGHPRVLGGLCEGPRGKGGCGSTGLRLCPGGSHTKAPRRGPACASSPASGPGPGPGSPPQRGAARRGNGGAGGGRPPAGRRAGGECGTGWGGCVEGGSCAGGCACRGASPVRGAAAVVRGDELSACGGVRPAMEGRGWP